MIIILEMMIVKIIDVFFNDMMRNDSERPDVGGTLKPTVEPQSISVVIDSLSSAFGQQI